MFKGSTIFNMFGLPPPPKRTHLDWTEVTNELRFYTYGLDPRPRNGDLADRIIAFFQHRPDLFESRLEIIRFALANEGDLTELIDHLERSDRELRELLNSVEV